STHRLLGLGTFLAVLLHKPLDSMSITSLMASSGWNRQSMFLVNLGFALICPLGAVLCFFGLAGGEETSQWAIAAALAFSAGVFICIALADILPEIQFHSHDRLMLSVALLLGVLVAWLVELSHTHSHEGH